jgi:hypothetical protein
MVNKILGYRTVDYGNFGVQISVLLNCQWGKIVSLCVRVAFTNEWQSITPPSCC